MSGSNKHFNDRNAPVFSVEKLVATFRQSSEKISALHGYSSDDFNMLGHHIREYHKLAAALHENISRPDISSLNPEKNLSGQAEASLKNISEIVTKLQFHDIIRQQLEHIQQTNESVIEELLSISRLHVRSHTKEIHNYLSIVPDIIRLHVAQLTHTNLEYQNAFADIKANLEAIRRQTATISGTYTAYCKPPQQSSTSTEQAEGQPGKIIKLANNLQSDITRSLDHIKNCESFEKLVGEINGHLTLLLSHPGLQKNRSSTQENKMVAHLKNIYTMESERIVHDKALGKNPVPNTHHTETDENLELF